MSTPQIGPAGSNHGESSAEAVLVDGLDIDQAHRNTARGQGVAKPTSADPLAIPNAIEAEQSLIGACLINAEALDVVEGLVTAEDFGDPLHALLFTTFQGARAAGRSINVTLVKATLGPAIVETEISTGVRVGDYLGTLLSNAPTVLNAPDFARIIAETAAYRRIAALGEALRCRAMAAFQAGPPHRIATEAIAELDGIASQQRISRGMTAGAAAHAAAEAAEDRALHGVVDGVSWGLRDLDEVCRLQQGELTILAARPSMGKTTLALSVALAAAKSGTGVLLISLEMGAVALGERMLADLCYDQRNGKGVTYTSIRDGVLNPNNVEAIHEAAKRLETFPLQIDDQAGLTAGQIVARARSWANRFKQRGSSLGLVVIDHLGLIAPSDRYKGARHLELGDSTAALKGLAKELGLPVLLLCQLSRANESRENKRPQLSDLRESGRIEEDADVVVLLYREAYYLERLRETDPDKEATRVEGLRRVQNTLEINVAKHRQGATRTVEVFASMPCNAVRDLGRGFQ